MSAPTIVRIEDKLVELTQQGWKTNDAELALLCRIQMETGAGGFHCGPNPHESAAKKLVTAFKDEGFDAEIISIAT